MSSIALPIETKMEAQKMRHHRKCLHNHFIALLMAGSSFGQLPDAFFGNGYAFDFPRYLQILTS